ncbi:hypothetical protein ZHAS_00015230 [Anopheles sinensis]|uniref:Uncharacterized protein n=1 Tax=Anopheles sinensis TaxID=74873 RepID=A0A084WAG3_ANOSI|nr:hypothetical protein ZHAS_00015230 [Anopheles sinensis]
MKLHHPSHPKAVAPRAAFPHTEQLSSIPCSNLVEHEQTLALRIEPRNGIRAESTPSQPVLT